MDGYLFLVHIGPVQTFIASGRRTRDLYYGSGLLSEISKVVAKTIADKYSIENLIFPAPEDKDELLPGSSLDVANKIVAHLPQGADPQEMGRLIDEAKQAYLEKRRDDLENTVFPKKEIPKRAPGVNWETVQQQLDDMIDYYWVALPLDIGDYATARLKLEAIMAARKNAQRFQQPEWSEERYKSSISGELESIIPERLYPVKRTLRRQLVSRTDQDILRQNAETLYNFFHAGPAERLSGIDLLKRRGIFENAPSLGDGEKHSDRLIFPSTSHLAALPYLQCLSGLSDPAKTALKNLWRDFITRAKALAPGEQAIERVKGVPKHPVLDDYDGGMLYAERLIQDADFSENLVPAQSALHEFFEKANSYFERKIAPSPYYAILIADGDGMGDVISSQAKSDVGARFTSPPTQLPALSGIEKHRLLTQALARFAREARAIISSPENQGVAIYTGGDDVMAFLPLHRVLPCGLQLAQAFQRRMGIFLNEKGQSPTLSAGIAIVHHLELLQESLSVARAAEKRAKSVRGKNAVAITLAKRSGEQYSVAGHWNDLDYYITQLVSFYAARSIPKGIAYDIRDTMLRLTGPEYSSPGLMDWVGEQAGPPTADLIRADIQRILLRRLLKLHHGLEPDQRKMEETPGGVQHSATTLYELLLARICRTEAEFGPVQKYTEKERRSDEPNKVAIRPALNRRGTIDFQEFANELLIAQALAETEILLNTPRKEPQA